MTQMVGVVQQPVQHVVQRRLWWVGLVAAAVASVVNVFISLVAVPPLSIPASFLPLQPGPLVNFTSFGVIGATLVFWLVGRRSSRPVRTFTVVAGIVLVLSFLPDIPLATSALFPDTTIAAVIVLMVMHITTAVIAVGFLTRLAVFARN